MRRQIRPSARVALILLVVFTLASCQEVDFTAQITPLIVYAPGTQPSFGTVGVTAIYSPISPTVTPTPIVSFEEESIWSPTFERVECGIIDDDVSFEICYGGNCAIYGNDDDRVTRFVDMVDKRNEKITELEILQVERGDAIIDAFGDCATAGAVAGVSVVAIIGLTAPEPTVSKLLGGLAGGAAVIICGGSIRSAWHTEGIKQQKKIEEIEDAGRDAVYEFLSLQRNPP